MACCAFAVFVISQIAFGCLKVWRLLTGIRASEEAYVNAPVSWSLASSPAEPAVSSTASSATKSRCWPRSTFLMASLVLFLLLGGAALYEMSSASHPAQAWCGNTSIDAAHRTLPQFGEQQ